MSTHPGTLFEAFLNQHDDETWDLVVQRLLPEIHEVDRNATQIWFRFFPLALLRALQRAEDPAGLAVELRLQGKCFLKDQIDESHSFLYGHRYWPAVKAAISEFATAPKAPASLDLSLQILEVASIAAKRMSADRSLLVGMTAAGFMTLQHVGIAEFTSAPGATSVHPSFARKSPEQVLKQRARDDGQGIFGFLRGSEKIYSVIFNECDPEAKFKLIATQELTNAAANDKRDYFSRDPRCIPGEGPIPVQCRSAACGTCWVGILGGAEKLSEVRRLEAQRIKEFGYIDTSNPKPIIRLACQAQAVGAVSIVIPPWNGVFGKHLARIKEKSNKVDKASRL